MCLTVNLEREDDGRWIAEVPDLPGVMVYGQTRDDAISKVKALTLRILADRIDHGESVPEMDQLFSVTPRANGLRSKPAMLYRPCSGLAGP